MFNYVFLCSGSKAIFYFEKQLVTKRTIEKIILSKESMEVIVTLQDRRDLKLAEGLANRLGKAAHNAREGAVNPDAPACSPLFETQEWRCASSPSNQPVFSLTRSFILSHDLLRATHLKKK